MRFVYLTIFWFGFTACVDAGVFVDKTASLAQGLDGSAASWGDYNNDGYVDLNASGIIWRNNGGEKFTSIGRYGTGGPWADYDNDGLYAELRIMRSERRFHRKNRGI